LECLTLKKKVVSRTYSTKINKRFELKKILVYKTDYWYPLLNVNETQCLQLLDIYQNWISLLGNVLLVICRVEWNYGYCFSKNAQIVKGKTDWISSKISHCFLFVS
jgi:hypothetical protein